MREEKLRVAGMQVAPSFAPGPSAEAPPERGGVRGAWSEG